MPLPVAFPFLLQEQHIPLHDRVVFYHAERPVCPWADQGLEVAGHGHGDETDSDGPGLCFLRHGDVPGLRFGLSFTLRLRIFLYE